MLRAARTWIPIVLVACLLPSCGGGGTTGPRVVLHPIGSELPRSGDVLHLAVEVAATGRARNVGLSNRLDVPEGTGMLFAYATPAPREFWMKDCVVGLDIAFLDAGARVLSLHTMPPGAGLPYDRVPRAKEPGDVLYVLEAGSEVLVRAGLTPGEQVDVSRVMVGVEPE